MSDFMKLFLQQVGGGPSIDMSMPPELLCRELLNVQEFEPAALAALRITERSKMSFAKEAVWLDVMAKGRLQDVREVGRLFGYVPTDREYDKLLERYKKTSLTDAVEIVKSYGSLQWGPIIDSFMAEIGSKADIVKECILTLKANNDHDGVKSMTLELERVTVVFEELYALKTRGIQSKPPQQDGRNSNRTQGRDRGPRRS